MTFLIKQVNQLNQYTIMGLSNGSSEGTVYLKLKGMRQEDAYPFLTRTVKKDDKWTTEGEWKQISGQLKSIKFKTFKGRILTNVKYNDTNKYLNTIYDLEKKTTAFNQAPHEPAFFLYNKKKYYVLKDYKEYLKYKNKK